VFGGTGVVGFSAAVIAAGAGATATLVGYDGPARVKAAAADAKARFGVELAHADGSSDALKTATIEDAEVILCAGRAGVNVLGPTHLAAARRLMVAADVNAVPPAGIAGLGAQDDGAPLAGTPGIGIGALAVGGVKYRVESGLFKRMIETEEPLYLGLALGVYLGVAPGDQSRLDSGAAGRSVGAPMHRIFGCPVALIPRKAVVSGAEVSVTRLPQRVIPRYAHGVPRSGVHLARGTTECPVGAVRGEQAAITTRLSPFSTVSLVISSALLEAQENNCSCAWTTLGRVNAYSTAAGTSTTLPILAPQ